MLHSKGTAQNNTAQPSPCGPPGRP
jgi:hypothetical protein